MEVELAGLVDVLEVGSIQTASEEKGDLKQPGDTPDIKNKDQTDLEDC